jgi:hypothetical protein
VVVGPTRFIDTVARVATFCSISQFEKEQFGIIVLPQTVHEENLSDLLFVLSCEAGGTVMLDFGQMRFWDTAAIIVLLTKICWWSQQGRKVTLTILKKSKAYPYLQRIDFFNQCGISLDESFTRHTPRGRFLPIKRIGRDDTSRSIEQLSTEVATCVAPDQANCTDPRLTSLFDCIEYAISELALNVKQHSQGVGFITAQ